MVRPECGSAGAAFFAQRFGNSSSSTGDGASSGGGGGRGGEDLRYATAMAPEELRAAVRKAGADLVLAPARYAALLGGGAGGDGGGKLPGLRLLEVGLPAADVDLGRRWMRRVMVPRGPLDMLHNVDACAMALALVPGSDRLLPVRGGVGQRHRQRQNEQKQKLPRWRQADHGALFTSPGFRDRLLRFLLGEMRGTLRPAGPEGTTQIDVDEATVRLSGGGVGAGKATAVTVEARDVATADAFYGLMVRAAAAPGNGAESG
ncbi:hypothetical protein HK405_014637, partial [Cladochytrium tenue]